MSVERLKGQGFLEEVESDRGGALVIVDACERHIESARAIATTDPSGAFQLAYDAARKAIGAHMLASGLRAHPRAQIGAHVVVGKYAETELVEAGDAATEFDRMRRRRNRTEYGVAQIQQAEIEMALMHAAAIVAAVREALA